MQNQANLKSENLQNPQHKPQYHKTYSNLSNQKPNTQSNLVNPIDSSDEGDSNELRYLSHLDNTHSIDDEDHQSIYLAIYYRAVIYVRKEELRTQIDDGLFQQQLRQHVNLSMQPSAITKIGEDLLSNGYVLAAIAILLSRNFKSTFLLSYLFNLFTYNFNIKENEDELFEYSRRETQTFNIPVQEKPQKKQKRSSLKRLKMRTSTKTTNIPEQQQG